jgi:hypothetical protein
MDDPESELPEEVQFSAESALETDSGEIVQTPPEERFPPLNPVDEERLSAAPPSRRGRSCLLNLLTVFFFLATLGLLAYFSLLWVNPYHELNPLPPYTPLPVVITTTPLPPTPTEPPTFTPVPATATFTPIPAEALPASPTFTPSAFAFTLAEPGVDYAPSASGCDWSSVAGTVTDLQGEGLEDYGVRIRSQEGDLNATVTTGDAAEIGPGGFELQVSDSASLSPYTIQLLDPNGEPVSEEYLVVTSDVCEQNVVLVSFVQNR